MIFAENSESPLVLNDCFLGRLAATDSVANGDPQVLKVRLVEPILRATLEVHSEIS